ncbi:uncharacterized protein F5891DRAFT_1238312 [Suillus fuscotomentosus]|uniref:Uncharacterized protein n=1 Tax=Suillus fuscotomentosus TaxID=1912939 RepID=A0AAD4E669_9AGAM|nr:uncharacterized protein F5891DRAFT_316223 [Suillus fuscotomentosus]XP_041232108.1 uncharacterized protein F5891DRAFT_1238312 [Suillus fuscotomentosus]KAG1900475.1 hypothetical protein F5891DRAFT_316223 [Suillus fuscotomentosus]KAG1906533.1 hypothetical protein F5891DRAFT_1238312 [Suillus fuscotomentosus]
MGRNAKLHKRIKKKTTASSASHPSSGAANTPNAPVVSSHVQAARRRADLKSKSKSKPSSSKVTGERVLGGADYVTLLMGGRKKAAKEALKLPKS